MRKLYQTEWFGIEFTEFAQLSKQHLADSQFYALFYERFRNRYRTYDALPEAWRRGKDAVATHLADVLEGSRRILSIGSGIGYVETRLAQILADRGCREVKIVALEPGAIATYFSKPANVESINGFFPKAVAGRTFDAVYASNIDYCFLDHQYEKLLRDIHDFGAPQLLLTNIIVPPRTNALFSSFKSAAKWLLSLVGRYKYGQFWGYLREISEHEAFLRRSGFQIVSTGHIPDNGCWIKARPQATPTSRHK